MASEKIVDKNAVTSVLAKNNVTKVLNQTGDSLAPNLESDVEFTGSRKKTVYQIKSSERLGAGGEAEVYMAVRKSDGEKFAAKINFHLNYHETNVRNDRKAIIEFLDTCIDCQTTHIMPLVDYGTVDIEQETGTATWYVDIFPFCPGGDLGDNTKIDYTTIAEKVVPAMNTALDKIHSAGLAHRDIKPSNLYWHDDVIVVSDFGTASKIGGKGFHLTQTARGTMEYSAPELLSHTVMIESDYFSLGYTLATLYNGYHIYSHLVENGRIEEFSSMKSLHKIMFDYPPEHEALYWLIVGLTFPNARERSNKEEIDLWLSNKPEYIKRIKSRYEGNARTASRDDFVFIFENIKCTSIAELIKEMSTNWEAANKYLYRGTVAGFFNQRDQTIANMAIDIVENRETAKNNNLGIARLLHYLQPGDLNLYWCGQTYASLSELSAAIEKNECTKANIEGMLTSKYLSWKMKQMAVSDNNKIQEQLAVVCIVEDLAAVDPQLAYYYAMYIFSSHKITYLEANTVDEYFNNISISPTLFYKEFASVLNDKKGIAFIASKGYLDPVRDYRKSINNNFRMNLEYFYRLFEGICSNKSLIREHYYKFGPSSHLYWLKENLKLYTFSGTRAKMLNDDIRDCKLSAKMPIDEQVRVFSKLDQYSKDFAALFQGNIFLAIAGIWEGKDKDGIISQMPDAFFTEEFYGIRVPAGYKNYITGGKHEKMH